MPPRMVACLLCAFPRVVGYLHAALTTFRQRSYYINHHRYCRYRVQWNDFIICFEMAFFAVMHEYAFGYQGEDPNFGITDSCVWAAL